jgi:hypothetical protein
MTRTLNCLGCGNFYGYLHAQIDRLRRLGYTEEQLTQSLPFTNGDTCCKRHLMRAVDTEPIIIEYTLEERDADLNSYHGFVTPDGKQYTIKSLDELIIYNPTPSQ